MSQSSRLKGGSQGIWTRESDKCGIDTYVTLHIRNSSADTFDNLGLLDKAVESYKQNLDLMIKAGRVVAFYIIRCRRPLGKLIGKRRKDDEVEELYRENVRIRFSVLMQMI